MNHTKHKPVETTAYFYPKNERVPVKLTLEIDWPALYRDLARRAYLNKNGRTQAMNGIIVGHVNTTRHQRPEYKAKVKP